MAKWRIYYDDGTTFDSSCYDYIPSYGVQCIVDMSQKVKTIHNRSTYYILTEEGWIVTEQDGLLDFTLNKLHLMQKVVMGRTMVNDAFWATYNKALNDEI